ncbi:Mitochondrial thiamine pyrophosphate carrier 1 [Seminavis robusta]|uniref:Mitochondrial thiamine pyrophosphate carrier 1 n=1 Tax=Seminavis robusta TaxID=568900 RepID=A0A9N8HNN1_9STRA|nr:Mitochondrial thiamine pyrophosphate carrier 1 [Seminavis robusta]|eukprot:Sro1000_g229730.1 Mitochondrial thiamine pyrophosphate carrier 1 (304) ;mRNA; r:32441-33352
MSQLDLVRTRPAFEKLAIGPLMIFGEMVTGGHYLEILKYAKQMHVGHQETPSYWILHRNFLQESGGKYWATFYRGFAPWGLIECYKGIPVLFIQHEAMYQLQAKTSLSHKTSERISGVLGGAAQALFVCPLIKLKVTVVADAKANAMTPTAAMRRLIATNGVASLMDGIVPMVLRRSLDWGIRFAVAGEVKDRIQARRQAKGLTPKLEFHELLVCGLIGGAASAVTHPIDNVITNSQKPLPYPGAKRDFWSVIKRMYRESGMNGFTRAWGIKIVDNAYHLAWMYGVGTVAYDYMARAIHNRQS